eukprot:TRINITY_DN27160_c0_g3_i1.p1 TRINITY_DN27160_c0_g3~~TRINITY_DN27160_c0_g3_i1.p1  ORF type:complete len:366 (-),score=33.89 TRINITY_DN27160_c0_g3_i1:174-1223(-)
MAATSEPRTDAAKAVSEALASQSKTGGLAAGIFERLEMLSRTMHALQVTATSVPESCARRVVVVATEATELVGKWHAKSVVKKMVRRYGTIGFRACRIVKLDGYQKRFQALCLRIDQCIDELSNSAHHASSSCPQMEDSGCEAEEGLAATGADIGQAHVAQTVAQQGGIEKCGTPSDASGISRGDSDFGLSDEQFKHVIQVIGSRYRSMTDSSAHERSSASAVDSEFGFSDQQLEHLFARTRRTSTAGSNDFISLPTLADDDQRIDCSGASTGRSSSIAGTATDSEFGLSDRQIAFFSGAMQRSLSSGSDVSATDSEYGLSDVQMDRLVEAIRSVRSGSAYDFCSGEST